MAAALKPSISVDSIFLTVSGSDMDTIRTGLGLDDTGGELVSAPIQIPYGLARKFVVQAVKVFAIYEGEQVRADTAIILQGETFADVMPGAPLQLTMTLHPVAPMMTLKPRYVQTSVDTPFTVDVRMFNIDSVAEVEAQLTAVDFHGNSYDLFDSLQRGPDVYKYIYWNHTHGWFWFRQDTTLASRVPLMNGAGDGTLIRAFLKVHSASAARVPLDTLRLQLDVLGITRVDRKVIPNQPIYVDFGTIVVSRSDIQTGASANSGPSSVRGTPLEVPMGLQGGK